MADFDTPNLRRLSLNYGETEDIRRILKERRPSLFKRSLSQDDYSNIHRYIVQLENCGPISIYVQVIEQNIYFMSPLYQIGILHVFFWEVGGTFLRVGFVAPHFSA
jgi:hypothetical protein